MQGWGKRRLRRTTLFSVVCAAVLVGLFASQSGLRISHALWWIVLFGCSAWLFRKSKVLLVLLIVAASFLVGLERGAHLFYQVKKYDALYGKSIRVMGVIVDDIAIHEARHQQEFHLGSIQYSNTSLPGRIQVRTFDDVTLTRGDTVVVEGVLRPSMGVSRQGSMRAAEVVVHTPTKSVIESFRTAFFAAIKKTMPEPHASLGLGYVVGLRVSLSDDVNEQLRLVGLTHIIAVSGYNLTILVQAARKMFANRSAYQAAAVACLLTVGFVVIAGGSASINRAAVVCGLSLLAWYYGREFKPILLLLLSGVVTGMMNPLYVWGDPGWYLSFLAFTGILLLAPLLTRHYFQGKEPRSGVQILLETMCAQLCTIPYSMYLFGGVSVIAPLANLLVLSFIPFIMICVAAVGVIGIGAAGVASAIAIVPTALLSLQLWIVKHLSSVAWAHQEVKISAIGMMGMFAGIIVWTLSLHRRGRLEEIAKMRYTDSSNNL